jgi:acyl-coenzyme A synthetase/AMP-(fatty) acid ligase
LHQTPAHDLSALERVFCAGEVLNAPAWEWLQERALKGRVPVIDHMWQTETSGPVFGNPYGIAMLPIKPGSASIPLPGIDAAVLTITTIEDERSVEEARNAWQDMREQVRGSRA